LKRTEKTNSTHQKAVLLDTAGYWKRDCRNIWFRNM